MQLADSSKLPGSLICVEGIDGCGKDTIARTLASFLENRGLDVEAVAFPDYEGPLGSLLLNALKDETWDPHSLQLLLSAERLRQRPRVISALDRGALVISSRYSWSAYVYSVARGLREDWAKLLEYAMPAPTLTILLDIDVARSLTRTTSPDALERNRDLLDRCRTEYLRLADIHGWPLIDATIDAAAVVATAQAMVLAALSERRHQ